MVLICKKCNKEFIGQRSTKKYCSLFCATGRLDNQLLWKIKKKYKQKSRNESLMNKYRKGKLCKECNSNNKLAVHHIDLNKYNNDISNFMVLCIKCHRKKHLNLSEYLFRN